MSVEEIHIVVICKSEVKGDVVNNGTKTKRKDNMLSET